MVFGLGASSWIAIAAITSALATVTLVAVTWRYVRLTSRLVQATTAGLPIAFDVVLTAFVWEGHPSGSGTEKTIGPFPEQVRIEGLGTRVFIHKVEFDARRGDPKEPKLGMMVGPVRLIDPASTPVSLTRGEVLYGGFSGSWALDPPEQEVGITIAYSLTPDGDRQTYTRLVRTAHVRILTWGHGSRE